MPKASVLIDLHPCRPDEVNMLSMSVDLARDVSLGQLDKLYPYLLHLLHQEVDCVRLKKINGLFKQINSLLWRGRKPWTPYDVSRESFHGLLAHGLASRLQRDEEELRQVHRHLHGLDYQPFIGDFS